MSEIKHETSTISKNSFWKKLQFQKLISESLLIIFSILLALVINEWRTTQKQEAEKDKALHSIIIELENNLRSLRGVMPYHKEVAKKLNTYLQQDGIQDSIHNRAAIQIFYQFLTHGFQEPRVQANAWHAAQLSGALSLFDNETIYQLSVLYELQEEGVESAWKKIVESLFLTEVFEPAKTYPILQKYQTSLQTLAGIEQYLIKKHVETLERLKQPEQ